MKIIPPSIIMLCKAKSVSNLTTHRYAAICTYLTSDVLALIPGQESHQLRHILRLTAAPESDQLATILLDACALRHVVQLPELFVDFFPHLCVVNAYQMVRMDCGF